jgi:hypothetical protein
MRRDRSAPLPHPLPLQDTGTETADPGKQLSGSVTVYDPAMCCPTGLCGPGVDPALLTIVRDLRWLEKHGVNVVRFGLAQQPEAFVREPHVAELMQVHGDAALPAVLVNGGVLCHGRYPSRAEIIAAL